MLVTARAGSEARIAIDLADALFPHDPEARPYLTGYPGLILVVTSRDPLALARLIATRYPIRGLQTLRPLLAWTLAEDPVSSLAGLLESSDVPKCRRLRVRVRGADVEEGALAKAAERVAKGEGDCVVSVEVLGRLVGVALVVKPSWPGAEPT